MKKKVFSLMMMLLLAVTGFVRADELTVHDGTATNGYVPVYGFYADAYLKCEMVYPASELSVMNGGQISGLTFGIDSPATEAWTATFQVFVKEVSDATVSDFTGTTGATTVYTGTLDGTGSTMTVNFTAPYTYNGGNLLVGFYTTTTGNYKSVSWAGETVNGASFQGYNYSSPESVTGEQRNFLPKTTFTYTGGGGGGGETVEVTIGDPASTSSSAYLPTYSLYEYSLTQQIYTADEIGVGGTINSLTMWLQNTSSYARNLNFYLKEANVNAFAGGDWVSMSANDLVGSITLATGISSYTETTINLSTPFEYTGNGNLVLCVQDVTGSWSSGAYGNSLTTTGYQALYAYRDGTVYDPTTPGVSGYTTTSKNVLRLSITTEGGGGGGSMEDMLHVKYMDGETEVIDTLNLGVRPAGAWMEPFNFTMYSEGPVYTVNVLDFTPSDGMFSVEGEELPFQVNTDGVELIMNVNTADTGVIERQFVAITEGDRAAHIWPVMVELYTPFCPDVWELACEEATTFPFVEVPQTAHSMELHNDYTLPFPEIPEGYDAVYKLEFDHDMILNAEVTQGENGKVALYREGFEGEGGPMATNYYTGLGMAGSGGAAATPFEALIGDPTSTSTTGYNPMYYLYNYSLSTAMYTATELVEAGATTAPMTSVSWFSNSTYGYNIQNVSIWMANVADNEVATMSPLASGMTLVYQGNHQEVVGENEFVFNQGSFAWDGHSNVLVMVQMNNGSWSSSISWQSTNPGFNAMSYAYTDNAPYDAQSTSYSMYTSSTSRANILFKASGGRDNRDVIFADDFENGIGDWTTAELESGGGVLSGYGSHSGDNVFLFFFTMNPPQYLISPELTGTENGVEVSFYYAAYLEGFPETFQVGYSTTTNDISAFTFGEEITATSPEWTEYTNTFHAGTKYVAVKCTSYYSFFLLLDDFTFSSVEGGGTGETGVSAGPVITNLGVTPGTYYLVASSTDTDLEVTINAEEMPCPMVEAEGFAFSPEPADDADEVEPGSVTLRWMVPEYATGWRLVFGSTYYPDPNHPQTIMYPEDGSFSNDMANSYTVRNLWNNTNYFWHVEFNNDGCPEGVSSPIWGFTTHLNVPQNLTVVDETVFNDEQIVLNWTAVVDRTFRMYNVYRDGELIGTTQVNNIGNATYTDGPLPYNMEGYTYYVTAIYDEGESAPSNTVNVKVSGRGDVNGHVYEQDGTTGIAGATVTMVGPDEFGVNHTYNFTTDANGYYSGAVYAGLGYDGQAAKEGYQTDYEPEQGEPIVINYNATTSPIDYILDENFDPVCQVIAEYYPDSLDPNSPYVKVYWGCGLPGSEIIEDFETGDFSMFEWQVDANYPWSVTTNNPYEGTYCMMSGGAGVQSVTSNMTVTVEIPADGEMSYFGKISCEQNWDYGYFYIDGVQKAQYTGISNWAEKKFDITAGTHTFQWQYTKDGSVDANDDRFYVDYITFYRQPEPPQPAQPGWHTYAEGDFNNAVGSNVGTSRWAYQYPVSVAGSYAGFTMTKVSLFSDNQYTAVGGNYTCEIYQGGAEPMTGTLVSTITVDVPSNQNAWVDFDLTTPVNVTGSDVLWVVWTANTTVSSWPAGCTDVSLIEEGTWWSAGLEAGYGWEHSTYGTWTMRQYFTNREGRGFYSYASENAPVAIDAPAVVKGAPVTPVKGQEVVTTTCATNNPAPVARFANGNRSLNHYRVYRTNCYNDGPYTEENTVLLATVWVPDTVYIDVEWADLPAGVYKWGVGAVYEGNRGELIEAPINWTAPQAINNNRSNTATPIVLSTVNEASLNSKTEMSRNGWLTYDDGVYDGGVGTYGPFSWGVMFPASMYNETLLTKVALYENSNNTVPLTLSVYQGGITAPGTLLHTQTVTPVGGNDYHVIELNSAVTIDPSQNLWIVFSCEDGMNYPANGCVNTGDPNGRWICFDGTTWQDLTNFFLNRTWMIRAYVTSNGGGGGSSGSGGISGPNELALPRESETNWSNCLDKDMYLEADDVTINVLLNSADSPEGVQVTFTNYNEAEQELHPIAPITLDETGFYAFDSFRRGNYKVNVTFDGYEPIEDSVSIWEPVDLRYVMTEIIYGVSDLYVSSTGWAMWGAEGLPPTPGPGPGPGPGPQPGDDVTIILTAGDVWGDGSGYQMLLDADATAFGTTIPETGALSTNCSGNEAIYAEFEYKIPANADGNCSTTNIVYNNSVSITIPAGTYDWCITNPTPGDRIWIASEQGNVGGRQNDYTFEAGNTYEFTVTLQGSNDATNVTITGGAKNMVAPMPAGEVKDIANVVVTNTRHLEYFKVMCTSIDGEPIFNADTEHPFCQVATDQLVPGEHYIAKVAAVYSTGMSAWSECEWQYIPCENYAGTLNGITIEGNTVSWDYPNGGTPGPGPQPGQGDAFSVDFEAGLPAGWTTIDGGNPTGYGWHLGSQTLGAGYGHNGSGDLMISQSYDNNYGVVFPDNYLVSPQVTLAAGSTFSFWACGQDASYAAEHFGVFVSDNGTSNWTMVNEWTIGQKGERYNGPRGNRDQSAWTLYSVDLSNFAGQKYIAIRHFNCSDMYFLDVDDVELTSGAKSGRAVIFDQAQYVTDPGAINGADASWTKGSQATWGPNANNASAYILSDDFTLSAAANIDEIECYGYQTGSSTTSTFTGMYVQIYNGNPMSGGSVIWGDQTTNIMTSTEWTGCYRGSDGSTDMTRPIMRMVASNLNINLEAGTYYIGVSFTGSLSSGPWGAIQALPNVGNTGNGLQLTSTGWTTLVDSGSGETYGIPFVLSGGGSGPQPPVPPATGEIIGAMIFVDGEWVAEVPYPTNTYTYEGEGEEVCVRMIYNGTNNLPEGNIYYSMSCPECDEFNPSAACEPGEPIHAEVDNTTDEVTVWWGEQPAPPAQPIEEWLYYDDGTNVDAIGLTSGGSFYWGIKFPAASMSQYVGCSVTKIAYFDYTAHTGTVRIYNGSNGNGPGTLIGTYNYTANGTGDWAEWTIPAVAFDNTQDLWIVMNNAGGQYVASMGNYTGDPNGTMLSTDGSAWYTLDEATGGQLSGTWNLRCFVSNQAKGEVAVLDEKGNGTPNGVFANAGVAKVGGSAPMNPVRATMVQYNVYRSTDNETYEMIGSVPYVEGQTYYEYVDAPGAGSYYYQVRALYDNDCESEPAPAFDDPTHNYVTASVDAVNENSDNVALYPNPTKGNVTIEAAGMSRITVVSVLGQVVYDTEVSEDTYVMNMSQFTAGMYMVRVYTESGVTVKRVTVMQ